MSDTTLQYKTMLDASGFASGAQQINSQLGMMGIRTQAASMNMGGLGTVMGSLASPLSMVALGITAVGGALVSSVQAAAAWESAMTGVAKTTGLAGPELENLSNQLLEMSTNMPVAAADLAKIAQVGGSLGIDKNELGGFTEVAAKMGVGFEMSAEQAATSGAKILNAFGQEMSTENLEKLGSVVNTMGDSFAATEPQVLEFLNRASFLNTTMGQSIPQVAALGTTLISAGMEAETASTGIKSALNMLTSETSRTGGMDNWAKLMGTDVETLKGKIASDLNGALMETADKIAAIQDPTERFQTAVQMTGTEGAPALLKLAGAAEDYAKALGLSTEEWENAQSLQKTYDAQMDTVNSKWIIFTNTISMAATSVGTVLLPAVGGLLDLLTAITKVGMEGFGFIGDLASGAAAVANTALGGGSMKDIDAAFLSALGVKTGDKLAEGVKSSEELKKAAAEALETPEAKAAMAKAAEENGETYADKFSALVKSGISKEIAGWMATDELMTDIEALALINKQSDDVDKDIKERVFKLHDTVVKYWYDAKAKTPFTFLSIDDVLITPGGLMGKDLPGDTSFFGQKRAWTIEEVLDFYGLPMPADTENAILAQGDTIEAALVRARGEIKLEPLELFSIVDEEARLETAKTALQDAVVDAWTDGKLYDAEKDHLRQLAWEFQAAGGDITDGLVQAIKNGDWKAAGAFIGEETGKSFADALGITLTNAMDKFDWSVILKPDFMTNPSKYGIDNLAKFAENMFRPEMIDTTSAALDIYNTELTENKELAADVLVKYQEIAKTTPLMFSGSQLMALVSWNGETDTAGQVLEALLEKTDKTTESLDRQTVGYNQLQTAIEECTDCAISDFGRWQEATTGLFQESYIGPGGQAYVDWKTKELQAIANTQAGQAAVSGGVMQAAMKITLDGSQAWKDAQKLSTDITALRPVMTVQVNIQAYASQVRDIVIRTISEALA